MSDHLFHLLPEIQEQIFERCCVTDLVQLSCCNSSYSQILTQTLWRKVTIPWTFLLEPQCTEEKRLHNLRFTRSLRFLVNVGWQHECEYLANYKYILSLCNPDALLTLVVDRHIDAYATVERPHCFEEIDSECIDETVTTLKNIRKFSMIYMAVSVESLSTIGRLNLQELKISDHGICDDKFAIICNNLNKLKVLNIEGNYSINDICMRHIANLVVVEELTLSKCSFTDTGLAHICGLTSLQVLNVNRCHNITDASIPQLAKLTPLRKLDLSHCFKITDVGIFQLTGLPFLEYLNLNYCMKITDAGLLKICKLTQLKNLKIASTHVTDNGLKVISNLQNLRRLNITRCRSVSDHGIEHLKNLPHLQKLNMSGTKIRTNSILHLHGMKNLTSLHIGGCHYITDAALKALNGVERLTVLDISYTKVTIHGLVKLTTLSSLRTLKCHHALFSLAVELQNFDDVLVVCVDSSDEQYCRAQVLMKHPAPLTR